MTSSQSLAEENRQGKVLILESGKCAHAQCLFCGYSRREGKPVNTQLLKAGVDEELLEPDFEMLKIFASGSFLDEEQFPREFRKYLADKCKQKNVQALLVESRPEFVTDESLSDFKGLDLVIAVGLEVADDRVLSQLDKGFTVQDFVEAAEKIHQHGFKVRAYLLANPPFVEDIQSSLYKSVEFALQHADSVVVINLLPHARAPLFDLWLRGEWKPLSREEFRELVEDLPEEVEEDEETFRFVPRFPREKKKYWEGVGGKYLENPHYRVWQEYLCNWYNRPPGKNIALFLPCSYKKPYSRSRTHSLIYKTLKEIPDWKKLHRIVISSPGVIPFEFNDCYPFNSYDWDESQETPAVKEKYVQVNQKRIKHYLENQEYKKHFCFLKHSSESYQALEKACRELGIRLENCLFPETEEEVKGNPVQSREGLEELREKLLLVLG